MPCIICSSTIEKLKFTYQSTAYYQCRNCGLVRTLPFPSPEEIENHYERKFKKGNYEAVLSHIDMYRDIYASYVSLLKSHCGSLEKKRLLDVGCFTGDFLDIAQAQGAITYGIELQKTAAAIASKKHPGRIVNSSFSDAAINEQFDIVTLFGVVEHLTNPEELLRKVAGWMKPNGVLVVQTPNAGSIVAKVLGRFWPPYSPIEHIHYFSKRNIKRFLESQSFRDIRVKAHVKRLSVDYVYQMLQYFGPEFHTIFTPLFRVVSPLLGRSRLPFFVGEMIVVARYKEKQDV